MPTNQELKEQLMRSIQKCTDMADVCQLAHELTVCDMDELKLPVTDETEDEESDMPYTDLAQRIFDSYYKLIIEQTGL